MPAYRHLGAFFFATFAAVVAACHASSGGGGTTCQSSPSCPGQSVSACTTTDDNGACTKMTFTIGDKEYACAACGDCLAAASQVAGACTGGFDAGGFDAGALDGAPGPVPDGGHPVADAGPTTTCDPPIACTSGVALVHCTTSQGAACLSESYAFSDGSFRGSCTCGNCAQTAALAMTACTGPADAGTDASTCGTTPALHPEAAPGVYCPFTATGATTCAAGDQCCEPPAANGQVSVCAAAGTGCGVTNALVWQCEDALDCAASAAGPVCCGVGAVTLDATCGFHRGTGFTGSHCAASCAAGEVHVCEAQAQCPAGTTCTPFKTNGLAMGACL
jgi:hypothetical protein